MKLPRSAVWGIPGSQHCKAAIELLRSAVWQCDHRTAEVCSLSPRKKVWIELPALAVLVALSRTALYGRCSQVFTLKRNCFFGKISSLLPNFHQMSLDDKLLAILCPANADIALCVSKYLGIISDTRTKLDQGLSIDMLNTYCKIKKLPRRAYTPPMGGLVVWKLQKILKGTRKRSFIRTI